MDDEEVMRDTVSQMLCLMGYEVKLASRGEEAIRLYSQARKSGQPFDAVLLDLTIKGGLGGKETVKKLLKIDLGVKAVVVSGYSADPAISDFKSYGFKGAIPKPFTMKLLDGLLKEVIL